MSAPDPFGPKLPGPLAKANWLGRYLEVQKGFDKELHDILLAAEKSAKEAITKAETKPGIGAQVRVLQLNLARQQMRGVMNDLFGTRFRSLIKGYQSDAAEAAVNASLYDQAGLLSKLIKDTVLRQQYADSLRQTARRNVESTITRVLFTEQSLSQRVWKTRALANGYIDRAINNGLARGDSARDIAMAVSRYVDPNTPGGVSYAAKRLGRTEIHNAFHAQSIADAQDVPWVSQMQWNLSKRHKRDAGDLCESYALTRFFDVERVPAPPHPNCLCFVTSVLLDYDMFEQNMLGGQYDSYLDDIIAGAQSGGVTVDESGKVTALKGAPAQTTEIPIELTKPLDIPAPEGIDALTTSQEVGSYLESKWDYHAIPNYNGLMVQGFTEENIHPEAARQVAHAIDDMLTEYPITNLAKVNAEDLQDMETYAVTFTKGQENAWHSTITHNSYWATDPDAMDIFMRQNVLDNFHPQGTDAKPFYWNTVHEFGHVLDDASNNIAAEKAPRDIDALFTKGHKVAIDKLYADNTQEVAQFRQNRLYSTWLKEHLPSGYALSHGFMDEINGTEATAEAFTDVKVNGYKGAKMLSRLLYDNLMKAVEDANIIEGTE